MDRVSPGLLQTLIVSAVFPGTVFAWNGDQGQKYRPDDTVKPRYLQTYPAQPNNVPARPRFRSEPRTQDNPWQLPQNRNYRNPVEMRPWGQIPNSKDRRRMESDRKSSISKSKQQQYYQPHYQPRQQNLHSYPYQGYNPYTGGHGYPMGVYPETSWTGRGAYYPHSGYGLPLGGGALPWGMY